LANNANWPGRVTPSGALSKLLGNCLRFIVEDSELQKSLRENRDLIAPLIEEALRLEGSMLAAHSGQG
jgi:hypothetical protein